MWPGLHHLAPHVHDALVGDRAIRELKYPHWIVVAMQSDRPLAVAPATHRERQLLAIAPLLVAGLNFRPIDGSLADARQRVANDAAFRVELRVVPDVLQLAAA